MSLKTLKQRKQMEEQATMLEILALNKIYAQIKPFIDKFFVKAQEENYKKLQADYKKTVKQLDEKTRELEEMLIQKGKLTKADVETVLDEAYQIKSKLEDTHNELLQQFTDKKDVILGDIQSEINNLWRNIETKRGPQGEPGKPGKDGSPDTAKQVVAKVNKEGGVKMSAIEGLLPKLDDLRKSIKSKSSKGGGMGNPQHETKSVGTGTTSITTTYPIAANGNAIIKVAYRKFIWHKDLEFTVGADNKTITLSADARNVLIDNSVIDLTYIRG